MRWFVEHTVTRLYSLEVPEGLTLEELLTQIRDHPWDWEEVHEQISKASAKGSGLELHLRH